MYEPNWDNMTHLIMFMRKREQLRKTGETKDWILNQYRFCNVHREDDRVTRWLRKHWRWEYDSVPAWWWFMVARTINWPPTLESIKPYILERDLSVARDNLQWLKLDGRKIFGSAYIISTNGRKMDKITYITRLWSEALNRGQNLELDYQPTCLETHSRLLKIDGLGSFMAAQVVGDMKNDGPLRIAPDIDTWAAPGPGSMRGLNRLHALNLKTKWGARNFLDQLNYDRDLVNEQLDCEIFVDAQDFQNCLCEFDKYMRALKEEGRPKTNYKSHAEFYTI